MADMSDKAKKVLGGDGARDTSNASSMPKHTLNRKLHTAFWTHMLNGLTSHYSGQESNRMSLLYFVLGALDLLDALPSDERKAEIIDWIYAQQILPDESGEFTSYCGWRGSPFLGHPHTTGGSGAVEHDHCHIAMAYTALANLCVLGDDFGRVNREAVLTALRELQCPDGSFRPNTFPCESDMRFVFCATAISAFLDDWSGMNAKKADEYILRSRTYEKVFGQGPGQEGHGGSTYCAVAALSLLGKLGDLKEKEDSVRWLLERQTLGFQGRPNKDPDTCYSWWVGGSLTMLDGFDMVDVDLCRSFTYQCETKMGGFGKYPGSPPDVLHSYYGLCGLSLMKKDGLPSIYVPLGISMRAAAS
eukprot:CAMPEP_0119124058 /NCGR_PEP_ID=MMETSP1310-20130426/3791_1 /TAXON_ID=464262 /ORGANISM="Genus nov. species nov., Strain RCC2339" /LENGTH=359 /DNA_ID=CAMNT_0007113947 /DNA_START=31 /DNA_END=1106 /DNA_ORIENTATION=+